MMDRSRIVVLTALVVSMPARSSPAAEPPPLVRWIGPHDNSLFGHAVDVVGDVDGDSVPDVLVAAYRHNIDPWNQPGSVTVYSGQTFVPLHTSSGLGLSWFGYSLSALGDVDGDGVPDYVVGATEQELWNNSTGYARVHSGATGAIVLTVTGSLPAEQAGSAVDGVGDIDLDGIVDFGVGARFASPNGLAKAGRVRVHSGATGSVLHEFNGNTPDLWLGWGLAGTGDTNGDGVPDLLLGAPGADTAVFTKAGKAFLRSGSSGSLLKEFNGASSNDAFGMYAGGPFDFDADGAFDVVVGAPNDDTIGFFSGSVRIYSGVSFSSLAVLRGVTNFSGFGRAIATVGDHDGDGRADLAIGAPYENGAATTMGAVRVYAAGSGVVVRTDLGAAKNDNFGSAVAGGFDWNGDGRDDLLIGAEQTIQLDGYAELRSGDCGSISSFGSGCAGAGGVTPTLAVAGCVTPLGSLQLSIEHAFGPAGTPAPGIAMVLLGAGSGSLPIGGGCQLLITGLAPWGIALSLGGSGPGAGAASISAALPAGSTGPWSLALQAFCSDPAAVLGYTTTNGIVLSAN